MCVPVPVHWCVSPSGLIMSSMSELRSFSQCSAHAYGSCFHLWTRFAVIKVNLPSLLIHCDKVTLSLTAFIFLSLPIIILFSSVFSRSYLCIKGFLSMRKVCELRLGKRWKIIRIVKTSMWFQTCMIDFLLRKTKGKILNNACEAPFQFNGSWRGWTISIKFISVKLLWNNLHC